MKWSRGYGLNYELKTFRTEYKPLSTWSLEKRALGETGWARARKLWGAREWLSSTGVNGLDAIDQPQAISQLKLRTTWLPLSLSLSLSGVSSRHLAICQVDANLLTLLLLLLLCFYRFSATVAHIVRNAKARLSQPWNLSKNICRPLTFRMNDRRIFAARFLFSFVENFLVTRSRGWDTFLRLIISDVNILLYWLRYCRVYENLLKLLRDVTEARD